MSAGTGPILEIGDKVYYPKKSAFVFSGEPTPEWEVVGFDIDHEWQDTTVILRRQYLGHNITKGVSIELVQFASAKEGSLGSL